MYPLTLPNRWFSSKQALHLVADPIAANWISTESSLTVRIRELGIAFSVEVLNQSQRQIEAEIQQKLNTTDTTGLYREVLLKQGNLPLVYAQTIMPDSTVTGTEAMLAELGNQSLGQVLFQSPQAERSEIEFAQIEPNSDIAQYIQHQLQQDIVKPCYIRRSLFTLNNKPLLVCECFLPALFL